MRTSTKLLLLAIISYGISIAFYVTARVVWNTEIERLKQSPFWGSTLDIGPYTNWAHYASLSLFIIGVAISIAAIMLYRTENKKSN